MENLIVPAMFMLVIGGVSGYLTGSLFKRVTGMALTIAIGAFVVVGLAYTGNLALDFDSLATTVSNVAGIIAPLGITALISSVPFVASFVTGLFLGYKRTY
jgi:uncharacterized membrane protein (Fun14 family)